MYDASPKFKSLSASPLVRRHRSNHFRKARQRLTGFSLLRLIPPPCKFLLSRFLYLCLCNIFSVFFRFVSVIFFRFLSLCVRSVFCLFAFSSSSSNLPRLHPYLLSSPSSFYDKVLSPDSFLSKNLIKFSTMC